MRGKLISYDHYSWQMKSILKILLLVLYVINKVYNEKKNFFTYMQQSIEMWSVQIKPHLTIQFEIQIK